jgi:anti-sigma factor RsiW
MTCDDVERLADAYADGELAVESVIALEAHVDGCQACAVRLARIRMVKQTLREAPYFRAPEALADRIRATMAGATSRGESNAGRAVERPRWQPWLAVAASLAIVSLAVFALLRQRAPIGDDATAAAVIEGHVRSLMADHLTDVASTDRHTVKPWFAGRLAFSPTVVDLASDGFPLVGGRLDYIEDHPAAALVYQRREHRINVFLWPQAGEAASHVTRSDPRGYHVIYWTRAGTAVWIVSDLAPAELDDFARKLDAAMRQ